MEPGPGRQGVVRTQLVLGALDGGAPLRLRFFEPPTSYETLDAALRTGVLPDQSVEGARVHTLWFELGSTSTAEAA